MNRLRATVSTYLSEILGLRESLFFYLDVLLSPKVGVPRTLLRLMPFLLAAKTANILASLMSCLSIISSSLVAIFIFVLFAEMLRKLAPWGIFRGFTAAPPHFSTEFRLQTR